MDGVGDARSAGVAYCPQHDAVPAYLTGREATELFARLEGLQDPVRARDVRFGRSGTVSFESSRSEVNQNSVGNYQNSARILSEFIHSASFRW